MQNRSFGSECCLSIAEPRYMGNLGECDMEKKHDIRFMFLCFIIDDVIMTSSGHSRGGHHHRSGSLEHVRYNKTIKFE